MSRTNREQAEWLADKIVALGDYAKEAAEMLRNWPVCQCEEVGKTIDMGSADADDEARQIALALQPSASAADGPGSPLWRYRRLMQELDARFPDPNPFENVMPEIKILAAIDALLASPPPVTAAREQEDEAGCAACVTCGQPWPEAGAEPAWPKLEKPASVGGGTFGIGVSSKYVVSAAQRQYEHDYQTKRMTAEERQEGERNRRELWDMIHGSPTTVQAEEPVALLKVGKQEMREWLLMRDLPEGEYRLALIGEGEA